MPLENNGIKLTPSALNLPLHKKNMSWTTASTSSRKPSTYLESVLKDWSSDPSLRGVDAFVPGQALANLNQIFLIKEKELP